VGKKSEGSSKKEKSTKRNSARFSTTNCSNQILKWR
jgi:hypothetical protein